MAKRGDITTDRFLDAHFEPPQQRRLSPLQGYELQPLVSLEEAVRNLEHLVDNIQACVWTATGNCKEPKGGLSPDERAAIYLYTMNCLYRYLNSALRTEDRTVLTPYFSYLKLLITALWKLPNVKSTVWRGVKGHLSDHQYKSGEEFVWWGMSSCTGTVSILEQDTFLGKKGPRTLFNIECSYGKIIDEHSQYPGEHEILLLPCSYFRVIDSIKPDEDLHIIHIQQIVPPVTLLKRPFPVNRQQHPQAFRNDLHPRDALPSSPKSSFDDSSRNRSHSPSQAAHTNTAWMRERRNSSDVPARQHNRTYDTQAGINHSFQDEFNRDGTINLSKWQFKDGGGGFGNNEAQYYTDRSQNARCENGRLIIEAHKENFHNHHYTSARLRSKQAFLYGRIQIRARLPSGRGTWSTILLVPERHTYGGRWPESGQIDLMVHLGHDKTKIDSGIHTKANNSINNNQPIHSVNVSDATTQFKIYTLKWDPDKIETFVGPDEQQAYQTSMFVWDKGDKDWTQWPFDKPFHLQLNLAVGGTWGDQQGIDDGAFPQRMEIDWIRFTPR